MEKDTRLINIYLKIHNKRSLTMDDLQYLALYSPECFEKTCKNVVYNFPNAKPIMEPAAEKQPQAEPKYELMPLPHQELSAPESGKIERVLDNLKRLERNDLPQTRVNASEVKSLLGNLFMELLFPHNDVQSTLYMPPEEPKSSFDCKA